MQPGSLRDLPRPLEEDCAHGRRCLLRMGLVVKGVLGSSNRPGLEETAQSVGDWVGVCGGGSKYHEACEFYHASSQLALPGIKTALWRLSLTLLSLSSPRDPLSVWLSTELLIQQPGRPMALSALPFSKAMRHGPMAPSRGRESGYRQRAWQPCPCLPHGEAPTKVCSRYPMGCFFQYFPFCLMKRFPLSGCYVY